MGALKPARTMTQGNSRNKCAVPSSEDALSEHFRNYHHKGRECGKNYLNTFDSRQVSGRVPAQCIGIFLFLNV